MSEDKVRLPKRKYKAVIDGTMSEVIATSAKDGIPFVDAKKQVIEYLDSMLEEYKDTKRRMRALVRGDIP